MPASLSLVAPTLRAIIDRVREDIATDTGEDDVRIKGTFARAAGLALAGAVKGMYGFAAAVANELHPATMVDFGVPLWGATLGLIRVGAIAAVHPVTLTFTSAATVPLGAVFTGPDGAEYTLDAAVSRGSAGTSTGSITATTAGNAGTLDTGSAVAMSVPVAGVNNSATVGAATTDGADEETLAAWKSRILLRLAAPPQGGSATDYEQWARASLSEVVRAYVQSNTPWLGNVTVYCTVTPTAGTADSHLPTGGQVATVQAAIDASCPAHAVGLAFAAAPLSYDFDPNIALNPDNAASRAAVVTALDAYCWSGTVAPGGVLDPEDVRAYIRAELEAVDTTYQFTLINIDGDAPPPVLTLAAGKIPVRHIITYSAWPF
jgi:uncharacterized phage protein gp47/JayE